MDGCGAQVRLDKVEVHCKVFSNEVGVEGRNTGPLEIPAV